MREETTLKIIFVVAFFIHLGLASWGMGRLWTTDVEYPGVTFFGVFLNLLFAVRMMYLYDQELRDGYRR
jgi:hypothetical protein